jgi:hypothetical protein
MIVAINPILVPIPPKSFALVDDLAAGTCKKFKKFLFE